MAERRAAVPNKTKLGFRAGLQLGVRILLDRPRSPLGQLNNRFVDRRRYDLTVCLLEASSLLARLIPERVFLRPWEASGEDAASASV